MTPHIWTLLGIMALAGAFGGIINYFIERRDNPQKSSMARSLVVGIGASFLVPLFLNMISSALMQEMDQDSGKLLVFIGFCLIASITSSAFIRTLSDKVLREASEAKRMSKELSDAVMPVLLRETEPAPEEMALKKEHDGPLRDSNASELLDALASGHFAWRTLEGLQQQTTLDRSLLPAVLQDLVDEGLAVCREDGHGIKRWAVSWEGKKKVEGGGMKMELRS
jgi:hypothetical protein